MEVPALLVYSEFFQVVQRFVHLAIGHGRHVLRPFGKLWVGNSLLLSGLLVLYFSVVGWKFTLKSLSCAAFHGSECRTHIHCLSTGQFHCFLPS